MHRLCHILLFFLPMISAGQNLVPNGIFNYEDTCSHSQFLNSVMPTPWFRLYSSPDFYHPCKAAQYSVPQNGGGGAEPHEGEGYIGLYTYYSEYFLHEFISVELLEPLVHGISYHAEFYVSRMDSCWFATRNIGMHFSEDTLDSDPIILTSLEPQVKYEGDTFLTSTVNWIRIEASFTANGGERYLTIGNYDSDDNTDTSFVAGGGIATQNTSWTTSYYYVDAVSVIPDSIFQSVNENDITFSIYPNPATTNLTIESRTPLAQVWVRDVAGRALRYIPINRDTQDDRVVIDLSSLPSGIYLVEVLTQNGQRSVQKVVVE